MGIQSSFLIKNLMVLVFILLILIIYYLIHIGNRFVDSNRRIRITRKKGLPVIAAILFIYIFYQLFNQFSILQDTLFTIIASVILAYLFNPIINYLERYNIQRTLSILILYVVILGVVFAISLSIIPRLGKELGGLLAVIPTYIKELTEFLNDLYDKYYSRVDYIPPIMKSIEDVVFQNIDKLQNIIVSNISRFINGVVHAFGKIISFILIPILTFYFLRDKDYFKNILFLTIPKTKRQSARELLTQIDRVLSQFIRGRLILAAYVGIVTTIILLILNVNFAIVIGLITGIADIIPYFGPFLGFAPAVIFAFLDNPVKGIWVGVIFIIIQWVENNVLAPKIIGDSIGIHPITVLLSLIIAGGMFGVMGMIFSVPAVAVIKILIGFFIDRAKKRNVVK
ncbi:MAG TPA: AI-2E family transporter [Tissierellia bacterium]|nr:AI-2E family transporter [Tissierellia bacterium]